MLPRRGGLRRRPANLRGPEAGAFHWGCFLPGLPGRRLCWCPPSPPAASPAPARDSRWGADGRGEGRKERAPQRAGWGRRPAGRGACAGKHPREGGGAGSTLAEGARGAAGTAPGPPSQAGEHPARPLPGRPGAAPAAAASSRPVLPRRPIRARLAGREAARGFYRGAVAAGRCQDGPRCSRLTVSLVPRREEPRPAAGPPPTRSFRANKMEAGWSLGGARSLGRAAGVLKTLKVP